RAVRGEVRHRPLEGAEGRRGPPPASAVGVHRREGPEPQRHAVRRRAGRAGHGEHDAGGDAVGGGRPRPDPRRQRPGRLRRRPRPHGGAEGRRRRLRRRREGAGGRGRREVRGVVEGAARLDPRRVGVQEGRRVTSVVTAGGISVTIRGPVVDASETVLERLVTDGVPGSLASRSPKLWGPDAAPLAARRLGWLDLPRTSRSLAERLAARAAEARERGLDRVVLATAGGAALAAEAMYRSASRSAGTPAELVVLDTTDPHEVSGVLAGDLHRTVVVVADGGAEAESLRRVFGRAFAEAGLDEAESARRFVVVAEEDSALARDAREAGHLFVPAEPDVDGRFGALGARALVAAALAGVGVEALLDDASRLTAALRQPYDNPALALGAVHVSGRAGFAAWAGQLVGAALGKDGKGLLPVVVEGVDAPGFELTPDLRRVILGRRPDEPGPGREAGVSVAGPLGAQFLLWEYAPAVAARVLGVDPFDEPDVAQSEASTAALLRSEEGTAPTVVRRPPELVSGAVEVHAAAEGALRN